MLPKCNKALIDKVRPLVERGAPWAVIAKACGTGRCTLFNYKNPKSRHYDPKFADMVKEAFEAHKDLIRISQLEEAKKPRKCIKCLKEKPLIDFVKHKSSKDGRRKICKECYNAYNKKYQKEHYKDPVFRAKNLAHRRKVQYEKYRANKFIRLIALGKIIEEVNKKGGEAIPYGDRWTRVEPNMG